MTRLLTGAIVLAVATSVQAQQAPPARVPPPPPAARPVNLRPAGSTLRCKDGLWAAAGAADAWCASHGGIGYRTVVITPPPKALPRPETPAPPPLAPPTKPAAREQSAAGAAPAQAQAQAPPSPPPPGATLLCTDGTYLTGNPDTSRCQVHGGLAAKLPTRP